MRSNLDPFGRAASDLDVWEALRRASLKDFVSGLEVPFFVWLRILRAQPYHLLFRSRRELQLTALLMSKMATQAILFPPT